MQGLLLYTDGNTVAIPSEAERITVVFFDVFRLSLRKAAGSPSNYALFFSLIPSSVVYSSAILGYRNRRMSTNRAAFAHSSLHPRAIRFRTYLRLRIGWHQKNRLQGKCGTYLGRRAYRTISWHTHTGAYTHTNKP